MIHLPRCYTQIVERILAAQSQGCLCLRTANSPKCWSLQGSQQLGAMWGCLVIHPLYPPHTDVQNWPFMGL